MGGSLVCRRADIEEAAGGGGRERERGAETEVWQNTGWILTPESISNEKGSPVPDSKLSSGGRMRVETWQAGRPAGSLLRTTFVTSFRLNGRHFLWFVIDLFLLLKIRSAAIRCGRHRLVPPSTPAANVPN